eukprot:gene12579-15803_t
MVGKNMTGEAQLAMPLDKLIEMNRSKFQTVKGKGSEARRKRVASKAAASPKKGIRVAGARKANIVTKATAAAGNRFDMGVAAAFRSRVAPPHRGNSDSQWAHDMYDTRDRQPIRRQPAPELGTKLFISNLAANVSVDDIQELFTTSGPLMRHRLIFDKDERWIGQAEVVFRNADDAREAIKQYNNVQLDGKKLKIELAEKPIATLSSGIRVTAASHEGSRSAPERGSNGSGSSRAFVQATRDSDRAPASRSSPPRSQAPPPRSRVRSHVVRQGAGDYMEE